MLCIFPAFKLLPSSPPSTPKKKDPDINNCQHLVSPDDYVRNGPLIPLQTTLAGEAEEDYHQEGGLQGGEEVPEDV
jgi:hypothetical protein